MLTRTENRTTWRADMPPVRGEPQGITYRVSTYPGSDLVSVETWDKGRPLSQNIATRIAPAIREALTAAGALDGDPPSRTRMEDSVAVDPSPPSSEGVDVHQTAETIDGMARDLRERANELERVAKRMRDEGDIELASDAANIVRNAFGSLRLDLLVSRPIRAIRRANRGD